MVIWPSFLYHNASCSSRSHGGVLDVHIIGVKVVGHVRVFFSSCLSGGIAWCFCIT